MSLQTHKYKLLLTKEKSEILQVRTSKCQEETTAISQPGERLNTNLNVMKFGRLWLDNTKKKKKKKTRIQKDSGSLIKIMSQPGIKMVYKDTMENAVRSFQTSVQIAVTRQRKIRA